jgi:hypothetical protein
MADMNRKYTIQGSHGRHAHSRDMLTMLGLKPGGHIPQEGIEAVNMVAHEFPSGKLVSILVWAKPRLDAANLPTLATDAQLKLWKPRKSSAHRIMCRCPGCAETFSVGRLHQHVCKD